MNCEVTGDGTIGFLWEKDFTYIINKNKCIAD